MITSTLYVLLYGKLNVTTTTASLSPAAQTEHSRTSSHLSTTLSTFRALTNIERESVAYKHRLDNISFMVEPETMVHRSSSAAG